MLAYGFTRFGGPAEEALFEHPAPVPGRGELLVRVRAAGVNPGDAKMREGAYGDVALPAVLGREVAGVVEAVGPGVTGVRPGDEVFGGTPGLLGGWAEMALVIAAFAAPVPAGVDPVTAAVLPVAAGTAFDALTQMALPEGATLLVNGAGGGVGVAAVQLAVARGLRVVGVAGPAKHDLVADLGAIPVAYGPGMAAAVRAAASRVDAVFDLAGGDALRAAAALAADPVTVRSVADRALATSLGGGPVVRDRSTAVLVELARLAAEGRLDPRVTETFPLVEARRALARVESGHAEGKVALRVEGTIRTLGG
ncbi:MAG: NADP-dependent oxidoreductase [Thermoleophilia bacterium]